MNSFVFRINFLIVVALGCLSLFLVYRLSLKESADSYIDHEHTRESLHYVARGFHPQPLHFEVIICWTDSVEVNPSTEHHFPSAASHVITSYGSSAWDETNQ